MLIAFSVQNFKSIRDLQTLSMESRTDAHLEWSNVITEGKLRLNKSAAIYGPNASGKSNLIEAMIWFRNFILGSSRESVAGEKIDYHPFRLSTETEHAPTHFEVEFRWLGYDYRYGFEVTASQVESEWLYRKSPTAKAATLFTREGQQIKVSAANFKEGKGLENRVRPNALFLSVCSQFNGAEAGKVMEWVGRFRNVSGLDEAAFLDFTAQGLTDPDRQKKLLEFARRADFHIESLRTEMHDPLPASLLLEMPLELKTAYLRASSPIAEIRTTRLKLGPKGKPAGMVDFSLKEDESQGTQKFIALSGPLTHTLEEGSILIVDELEARLHPRLTQAIVDLFHSPVNRKGAQLICATHEVSLLEPERFRRDQIWFCEKDEAGATEVFTLADVESDQVRATSKFSRQYMLGIFGAVPHLSHFQEAAAHATR